MRTIDTLYTNGCVCKLNRKYKYKYNLVFFRALCQAKEQIDNGSFSYLQLNLELHFQFKILLMHLF